MTEQDSNKTKQEETDVSEVDVLDKSNLDENLAEILHAQPEDSHSNGPTIESLQSELAAMKDQWMRAVAETENVRRRAAKEKEEATKYAITTFARNLLSVSDNMSRALESVGKLDDLPESAQSLISGIEMTQKELNSIFEKSHIQCISPLNEKFDPHLHQAMFEIENKDVEPGTVIQVLQTGYVLHDRLLRPALVAVSK